MNEFLKERWHSLTQQYSSQALTDIREAIVASYSEAHRHYHTLKHLEHIYRELEGAQKNGLDEAVQWAIWYHDVIYQPGKSSNEQLSADRLESDLNKLGVNEDVITKASTYILATKEHRSEDESCWLFLDADMAILGASPEVYRSYIEKVRNEFIKIPSFLYSKGRRRFLERTLGQPRIFYSRYFFRKYEIRARENIHWEIDRS